MLIKKTGLFLILSGTWENIKKLTSEFVRTVVFENINFFVCTLVKSPVVFKNIQYGVFLDLESNKFCKLLKKGQGQAISSNAEAMSNVTLKHDAGYKLIL